jgi:GlpG protein
VNWIIVKKFPLQTNLAAATGYLRQQGVVHKIYEERGEQVVAVTDPQVVAPLLHFLNNVTQGNISVEALPQTQPAFAAIMPSLQSQIITTPISSALIALSVLGALLVYVDSDYHYAYLFTFKRFSYFTYTEAWRLITPVFLHFGFFHVLFNALWVWDLGRRLEMFLGTKAFLLFFIITVIVSNSAQSLWSSEGIFGGMSGFVYALVGFIMVSHKLAPHRLTAVPFSIILFMLAWLFFCMTGILQYFMEGGIANAAHVGGLVAGCVYAFLFTQWKKLR